MNRKSTTHREVYRHEQSGSPGADMELDSRTGEDSTEFSAHNVLCSHKTTFFRLEKDGWYKSWALCSVNDNFCRSIGRSIARRKYFNGKAVPCKDPTHE